MFTDCHCQSLKEEISAPDCARLNTYAAYVRVIYTMGLSSRPIPRDVLNSLRAVYSGGSLFPHLKKYTWDTYVLCQIDLSFFAPPGLKGLIIDGSNDLKYVRRIKDRHPAPFEDSRFERTMKDLPGLLALSIRRFPASWVPSTTWAQIVQVRRLRSLSVDPLYHPVTEVEFLRKLSKLPALLELRLGVRPDWEASWDLAFRGFLALQTLTLHLHDNITAILPVFASPHLISLPLSRLENVAYISRDIPRVVYHVMFGAYCNLLGGLRLPDTVPISASRVPAVPSLEV